MTQRSYGFCEYCGIEMAYEPGTGWVDIADGLKTVCEESTDSDHSVGGSV